MITVTSKTELNNAINAGEKHILCTGNIAKELRRRCMVRKVSRRGILAAAVAAVTCLAVAPVTGGTSLIGIGAITTGLAATSVAAAGLTIGSVTISAVELAIICGTLAALLGHKIHLTANSDGSVTLDIE